MNDRPRRPSVLVVDDSSTVREDLRAAFLDAELEVMVAESLTAARRLFSRTPIDHVVLDVILPDGNGLNLLKELRSDEVTATIPVLVLTGEEDAADCLAVLGVYPDGFASKPYDRKGVVDFVRSHLPAAAANAPTPVPPPEEPDERPRAPHLAPAERPFSGRVLLVDDSLALREGLADQLRARGYDVTTATDGEAALTTLEEGGVFDAILLDVVMPGLGGLETCRRIKRSGRWWREVPVILVTGADSEDEVLDGFAAGADDYVLKLSNAEVFHSRVRAHVGRRRLEEETRRLRESHLRAEAAERARSARELAETRAFHVARLEAKNRELARSNAELEEVANAISDDLREPLRSVIGDLTAVENQSASLEPAEQTRLTRALEGVRRMHGIVRDIVSWARVEGAREAPVPIELGTIMRDIRDRLAQAIEETDADLSWESLPTVSGRPAAVAQLLTHLVDNAIRHGRHDGESASVVVDAERKGQSWVVSVRDRGPGIPARQAGRIFRATRPSRGGEAPSRRSGLAVAQKLATRHGLRLWVESDPGCGAAFRFTIPVIEDHVGTALLG